MSKWNLPYRYAQRAKSTTRDYVFFSAVDPSKNGELRRKRIYIDHIRDEKLRNRHAKKLIERINTMLDAGKNPFIDDSLDSKKYTSIKDALTFVMKVKETHIRRRTRHSFDSRMNILKEWLRKKKLIDAYLFEFTSDVALLFMNDLIFDRHITGRTFNNYLIDYRTFFNTLVKNRYISSNPFQAVERMKEEDTSKRHLTETEAKKYFDYVISFDYEFYIISLYCYYLALRPAEICRLKFLDINLSHGIVVVEGKNAKNHKKRIIPIAVSLLPILEKQIKKYPENYFICSKNLMPGKTETYPTRIAERFRKIAKKLGIPKEVKFYAFKDLAADKLIDNGFNAKTIRDLFGHSSIAVTDAYLKKIKGNFDERLINGFPDPV